MANAALYSMAAVYAGTVGLTVPQIAVFISANILGGLAFHWPIGRLSDKLDRRRVLTAVTFAAAVAAVLAGAVADGPALGLYAMLFLLGVMILPLSFLCIAHPKAYLHTQQMVSAAGPILPVGGTGALPRP